MVQYRGEVNYGGGFKVEVRVEEGGIREVVVVKSPANGYARLAEMVILRVTTEQRADVETITGATTSAKCILKAVEDALRRRDKG